MHVYGRAFIVTGNAKDVVEASVSRWGLEDAFKDIIALSYSQSGKKRIFKELYRTYYSEDGFKPVLFEDSLKNLKCGSDIGYATCGVFMEGKLIEILDAECDFVVFV